MRRVLLLSVMSALALMCGSCRKAVERAREKIRIEAVESVGQRGLTGIDATVRVANGTRHRLLLESARLDLYYDGTRAGSVMLCDAVEVPKRTTASVRTQWRVRIADPLASYALARRVRRGDLSPVRVSYAIDGRGGPVPVHVAEEMVPLSQFLSNFGLTVEDLKNWLR